MKYTIHKDLLIDMSGFENDQVSVISPKDYNSILYSTELTEMTDDKVEVGIKFIVRSTYSNEVLIIDNEPVKDLDLIVPEQEGIEGYFQVVHTLDKYLRSLATISVKLMARTHLMTLGVYYDSALNKIYHVMNLVVLDDDRQDFLNMFNEGKNNNWGKIVDIISSPSIGKFDKMLLSTLRIVN